MRREDDTQHRAQPTHRADDRPRAWVDQVIRVMQAMACGNRGAVRVAAHAKSTMVQPGKPPRHGNRITPIPPAHSRAKDARPGPRPGPRQWALPPLVRFAAQAPAKAEPSQSIRFGWEMGGGPVRSPVPP